jgi:hypothetical protein
MAGEPTYKPPSVRYRDGQPDLRQHRLLPCPGHPPGVFHQFRLSLAPWSVRDAVTDELFGRNTADRVAEGHRGIRGDQQESWPVRRLPRRECMRSIAVARPQINGPAPIPIQALPPTGIRRGLYERIHDAPPRQPAGTALLSRRCGCAGGPTSTTSYTAARQQVPSAENPWPSRVKSILRSVFMLLYYLFSSSTEVHQGEATPRAPLGVVSTQEP